MGFNSGFKGLTSQENYYITLTLLSELGFTQRTWGRVHTIYCHKECSSASTAYRLCIRASSGQRLKQTANFHELTMKVTALEIIPVLIIVQQDATTYSLLYFSKLLYMFLVVTPLIIRSTYNCNYSIWHWSNFGKCIV